MEGTGLFHSRYPYRASESCYRGPREKVLARGSIEGSKRRYPGSPFASRAIGRKHGLNQGAKARNDSLMILTNYTRFRMEHDPEDRLVLLTILVIEGLTASILIEELGFHREGIQSLPHSFDRGLVVSLAELEDEAVERLCGAV